MTWWRSWRPTPPQPISSNGMLTIFNSWTDSLMIDFCFPLIFGLDYGVVLGLITFLSLLPF